MRTDLVIMFCEAMKWLFGGKTFSVHIKNTESLIFASKEIGLEINVEKTKYMLLSCHQNVGQNWDVKIANRSFENVSPFKIFGDDCNKSKFDSGGN
jgi:hypothetical protein